jgi:hypothetical protein
MKDSADVFMAACRKHELADAARRMVSLPGTIVFWLTVAAAAASAVPLDWGRDTLVGAASDSLIITKLVTDADTTGDIYVGVLARDSRGLDTIYTWLSANGGDSWTLAYRIPADPSTGPILDCEVRVGHDEGGTWMYDFLVFGDSSTSGGLWVLRHRPPMHNPTWVKVVPGGDTILRLAADRNVENPQHLFVAWETQNGLINLMNSSDSGQTWGNLRTAFTGCERPALCAGGDGCVYVAANSRESAWVTVARYSTNLSNPVPIVARLDSSRDRRVWNPSVAADRNTPESLQTAIVMYCHKDTAGKITPRFGWTQTAGAAWNSAVWPATNQVRTTWDARFPCVRRSYDSDLIRSIVTMHEPSRNWDTLVYAFTRPGTPTVWEDRAVRNENRTSDVVGAKVGFSNVCMGGYAAYVKYGVNQVYFDGYNFVGASEPPTPTAQRAPATARLSDGCVHVLLHLDHHGQVRIAAFDCTGRMVARLFNGPLRSGLHQLNLPVCVPAGCLLLRIEAPGCIGTAKLVVTK